MSELLFKAINSVKDSEIAFCKFLSANDTGSTGAHQAGIYIPKNSFSILFDEEGKKGERKENYIDIEWQDDFITKSRFVYYGVGTRNEYRITRFGRGFPFLKDEYLGALFILCKKNKEEYSAYVLETEEEYEGFFSALGMTSVETNKIIESGFNDYELRNRLFNDYLRKIDGNFPVTIDVADKAREFYYAINGHNIRRISEQPDNEIIKWLDIEYELFKSIELYVYSDILKTPFDSVESFIQVANSVLNRRKSRAGKSLEHHLKKVFEYNRLKFTAQAKIEGRKRPDFIFPGEQEYVNAMTNIEIDNLTFLGVKTTCKDRWRQILNEADKIEEKHLFTLQQGISKSQLKEMTDYKVTLVVPKVYHNAYPKEYRNDLLDLKTFIRLVKEKQM
ncbi:Restriction endonuclease EcoRII, N-terminal [Dethiosulfatibacter aminovorans DSM 17477]|uniref:Restriction endonuclease EcoRII, N-terminal n=1 Tax=Dethiosulfatibacter aminovorans DSM 17477 TaxID=1121476 RepID=A0A1M6I8S8_9FIRM|nr:type II restriction endonuclease [Dethiosulfatibacter aminovorans]SHJ30827.1 Restriction endonuclease EcoRII, N-terminal [Dethiosulfatibacter aminovorans DSM 17477]